MRLFPSAPLAALALAVIVALPACGGGDAGDAPPTEGAARSPDGFIAVESGYFSSCGLRNDGSLICWGNTEYEPDPDGAVLYVPPPQGQKFTALSSGDFQACALREDGTPVCWGGPFGILTPPEGERFAQISVGSRACGLREDGTPICWSPTTPEGLFGESAPPDDARADIEESPWEPPEGERFASISVGGVYACGLRRDGSPICWGEPLGVGVGPLTPPVGERFTAISVGGLNACGLRLDGSPLCWTADIDDLDALPPVPDRRAWEPWEADDASSPEVGQRFADVSVGSGYACALRENGSPVCWNFSGDRLLDFGQTWAPQNDRFVSVSASFFHACAAREDGSPVCWGSLLPHWDAGQAAPPGGDRLPTSLPADQRFTAISNASDYVCGLRDDGAPVCAGRGSYSYYAPPEDETLASVSVSDTLGCGLREDGTLVCWPDSGDFERLWGDYVDDGPQTASPPEGVFTAVSVGESQACALREDGSPACWALFEAPEDVDAAPWWDSGTTGGPPAGERFASVSVGEWQACGLHQDGSPVCWPLDDNVAAQTTPAPSDEAFTAISGGRNHACALRSDGSPACWGESSHGQTSPPEGETFTAISSGGNASCGLRENGTFACWGSIFATSNGRVERGAGSEVWPPGEDERFIAVSVGGQRVCAIREDGSPVCWGGSIPS